ncbi:pigment-dispersing hormone peptides-like [Orussus abietinus]|uniref:pigment-dispersing hormone peptides-like n=1 Tax=Orussus abietinus TaxID=222816 RepID=UPI000626830E|nr:pigment-dispersing hormone peptides-like [Orussus abietinus]
MCPTFLYFIVVAVLGVLGQSYESLDDVQKNIMSNPPYGRGLDSELQLARMLLVPHRLCHVKRNSELINSLLGLPRNMKNAGK